MSRRKLHQLMRSEYVARSICSTGAEEAALLAEIVAGETAMAAGQAGAMGAGGVLGSAGTAAAVPSFFSTLGITPASAALQVGGMLVKGQAAADANARKKRLVDAMAAYQTGNAKKSMDVTGKFIEGATPEARDAAMAAAENENKLGFEKTVGAAQAFERPGGVAGKLSPQYTSAAADSADAAANRTKMLIANLSKMRAPGVAGATEARRFGRVAGDVDAFNSANAGVGRAYSTDIANVQENPWMKLGGNALIGAGLGVADKMKRLRASAL